MMAEQLNLLATTTEKIDPTTATIKAFDLLSAKNGNKGLEASRFAKPGVSSRASNSSRPRLSPLAPKDPNTAKSSNSFQDKIVESFRQEKDEEMKKTVRFAKMEGSSGMYECSATWELLTCVL